MAKFTGHTITSDSALGGKIIEKSLRFNRSGSHRINRTPASAGNRKTWTKSFWVKRTTEDRRFLHAYYISGTDVAAITFREYGNFAFYDFYNGYRLHFETSARFRDCTAWTHFVVSLDTTQSVASNRVKIYVNGTQVTAFNTAVYPSQDLAVSFNQNQLEAWGTEGTNQRLHFDGYLADIYYIDGAQLNPTQFGYTDELSGVWKPKHFNRSNIPNRKGRTYSGTFTASGNGFGSLPPSNAFNGDISNGFNNSAGGQIITWNTSTYNLSGNVRIYGRGSAYDVYVNGNATKVADMPSSNGWVDLGTHEKINEIQWAGTTYNTNNGLGSAGVHVNAIIVDGVWLRDDFHEFGHNGYHLEFKDDSGTTATTMGKDTSGNGHNWTPVNFSVASDFMTDIVTDSPSNNFCVLNYNGGSGNKVRDGGLSAQDAGTNGWRHTYGTFPLTRGKWYWEYRFSGSVDGSNGIFMGLAHADLTYERDPNSSSTDMYGRQTDTRYSNGTNTSSHFPSFSDGDTVQFAFDADTGVMWSGVNNTWTGAEPSTGNSPSYTGIDASKGYVPVSGSYGSNNYNKVNFGQQGFKYTPPSGFKAICSDFMEAPEIKIFNPKKHFGDLYYTGNAGTQSITGLQFKPDFVFIKCRNEGHHSGLFDSLRGVLKSLSTSRIDLGEYSESGSLNAFLPNGFSFNGQGYFDVNYNGNTFAAWCWKAGGSSNNFNIDDIGYSTASDAGITNGTINLTKLSVNTKGGFSIGLWTGSGSDGTVATGLTDTKIVILKNRTDANANWVVYHKVLDGSYDFMYLNNTNQNASSSHTHTLDTTFKVGSNTDTNASSKNYVFYAWKEIPGYSKIGTYKGFGNENGPCVYCGFRPKFVLVKALDSSEHWNIPVDTYNYNGVDKTLSSNLSNAERDSSGSGLYGDAMDYLSDGFKIKNNDNNYNKGGATYLFMAFADTPNLPHFNQYPTAR